MIVFKHRLSIKHWPQYGRRSLPCKNYQDCIEDYNCFSSVISEIFMIFLRSLFMMKTRNISISFSERFVLLLEYFTSFYS